MTIIPSGFSRRSSREHKGSYGSLFSKYDLEDYEAALVDIDKCIDLSSEDGDYYTHRGDIKRELKDFYSAINDYSKAIKLNPDDSENYK